MAISIVQTGTPVSISAFQTRSVPLTGTAAGNSMLIVADADSGGTSGIAFTASGFSSTNTVIGIFQGSWKWLTVLYKHTLAGGSENPTVDNANAGGNVFGVYLPIEVSGLKNQDAIIIPSNSAQGNSNNPNLTSGTLPVTSALLIAQMVSGQAVNPMNINTPSGYTSQFLQQAAGGVGGTPSSIATRIVSANTAQSPAWGTMAGAENWVAGLFGFEEAAAAGPGQFFQYQPFHNVLVRR
jgi:hypothetical protein